MFARGLEAMQRRTGYIDTPPVAGHNRVDPVVVDVAAKHFPPRTGVLTVEDGTDLDATARAIRAARAETTRPSLIAVRNHIGYGSPKQETAAAHGEPLGAEDVKATKERLGWPLEPTFFVPGNATTHFLKAVAKDKALEREWHIVLQEYAEKYPDLARQYEQVTNGELPTGWDSSTQVASSTEAEKLPAM